MTRLYLRHLDQGQSVALSGTESAAYPFWSPDNRFIGFFEADGEAQEDRRGRRAAGHLCTAEQRQGAAPGTIAATSSSPAAPTPASSGAGDRRRAGRITAVGPDHNSTGIPVPAPAAGEFLFIGRSASSDQDNTVFLANLDTTIVPRIIATSQAHADYVDGYLLTVRENVLMATPFTPDQRARPRAAPRWWTTS
ncbi:MAG: hypothetical protein IPH09_10920 [bacterium]|nr:hypothetical protein [bacterium]